MARSSLASGRLARIRRAVRIRGTVQGVGFRPAMYRLAQALELGGFVKNSRDGVWLEIEGAPEAVARFLDELPRAAPAGARIESVTAWERAPRGDDRLVIELSESAGTRAAAAPIPPDRAPCEACVRELSDPTDRRHGYAFINCTACGPRFTIVEALPYDRARTTMARFALCAACRREYEEPGDRRFHAEPNACAACGPQPVLSLYGEKAASGKDAIARAAEAIARGAIVAIKGAGGFALATDAQNDRAVMRLRARKQRPDKPLAVMVRDLAHAGRVAVLDAAAREALLSPARPIVLVPAKAQSPLAKSIAPGLSDIGLMLPPTPLQWLIAAHGPPFIVMTSGNRADEPIAIDGAQARRALDGIADGFLDHDRAIAARADDSVVRMIGGRAVMVRRARGFVPEAIALPFASRPVLAAGAEQHVTFCLAARGEAVLSQHIGSLSNADSEAFYRDAVNHLSSLLGIEPEVIAHDLHPDYRSTRLAEASGLPRIAVQHHHAHIAACMADNARTDPVLGVALDGTGYGPDETMWGGELLEAGFGGFRRLAHIRPLALAGGHAAIRAPWRLALAALADAGEPLDALAALRAADVARVRALIDRRRAPLATGAGRLYDAVSALCGLRHRITYDGQSAMELEAACVPEAVDAYPITVEEAGAAPMQWDTRPVIRALVDDRRRGVPVGLIAARFHETLAQAIGRLCVLARDRGAPKTVALAGGCFLNRRLCERVEALLGERGFEVLVCRRVPPGDGGLALGQAAVAAWQLRERET